MKATVKAKISLVVAAVWLLAPVLFQAQSKDLASAPLPSQLVSARKVFVSNAGDDSHFKLLGDGRAYNQFYAAMKDWGRFELVSTPSESDVILEICLASQLEDYGSSLKIDPVLRLTIIDPKTRTTLWAFNEEIVRSFVRGVSQKQLDNAMDRVVEDLRGLVQQSSTKAQKP